MNKKVALVLSSGGARGFAHIGAIEALLEKGYEISSVTGTSMGALIGAIYATGKLPQARKWMFSLNILDMLSLMDLSLGFNHIVKGDKIMNVLRKYITDINIEDLKIPYVAIASDLKNNQEIVFDQGNLFEAVRASISIPSFFRPVKIEDKVLIDGGVINPLPLNRAKRENGDIMIAVNVSAPEDHTLEIIRRTASKDKEGYFETLRKMVFPDHDDVGSSYFSLITKTFALMIQQNTVLMANLYPPDLLIDIPMNRFGAFDYQKAEEISNLGYAEMKKALSAYESECLNNN